MTWIGLECWYCLNEMIRKQIVLLLQVRFWWWQGLPHRLIAIIFTAAITIAVIPAITTATVAAIITTAIAQITVVGGNKFWPSYQTKSLHYFYAYPVSWANSSGGGSSVWFLLYPSNPCPVCLEIPVEFSGVNPYPLACTSYTATVQSSMVAEKGHPPALSA